MDTLAGCECVGRFVSSSVAFINLFFFVSSSLPSFRFLYMSNKKQKRTERRREEKTANRTNTDNDFVIFVRTTHKTEEEKNYMKNFNA
jgi:hypothetical protein